MYSWNDITAGGLLLFKTIGILSFQRQRGEEVGQKMSTWLAKQGWAYSQDILNFPFNLSLNILIKCILIKKKACTLDPSLNRTTMKQQRIPTYTMILQSFYLMRGLKLKIVSKGCHTNRFYHGERQTYFVVIFLGEGDPACDVFKSYLTLRCLINGGTFINF